MPSKAAARTVRLRSRTGPRAQGCHRRSFMGSAPGRAWAGGGRRASADLGEAGDDPVDEAEVARLLRAHPGVAVDRLGDLVFVAARRLDVEAEDLVAGLED